MDYNERALIRSLNSMDTRFHTVTEWRNYFSHLAEKHGARYASGHINGFHETYGTTNEFLYGMQVAFSSATGSELRRLLHVVQALSDADIRIPMDVFFQLGLPQKEFIVKCKFTHGRLGDYLSQMAYLLHAMRELSLVLALRPYGSTSKSILLTCSDEFNSELFMIDMNTSVFEYLKNVASSVSFDRRLLFNFSSKIFCNLDQLLQQYGLKKKLEKTIVVHVRSGDGLFDGCNMFLPPLNYYLNSIEKSGLKKVLVVAEPFYEKKDPFPSPVPGLIASACANKGIECNIQSSSLLDLDVAALFYASHVVASNSLLSTMIPLYGDSCKSLTLPDGDACWIHDACMTRINCWKGFNEEEWRKNLDYRIAWVSGQA